MRKSKTITIDIDGILAEYDRPEDPLIKTRVEIQENRGWSRCQAQKMINEMLEDGVIEKCIAMRKDKNGKRMGIRGYRFLKNVERSEG